MPRISETSKAQRRAQILRAARTRFSDAGFHQTSMDDIIKASGLSAGAVYTYFSGKDELIRAAGDDALGQLSALAESAVAELIDSTDEPVVTSLSRLLTLLVEFANENGTDISRIAIFCWGESLRDESYREFVSERYGVLRAILVTLVDHWKATEAIPADADSEAVAKTLMSVILGFITQRHLTRDISIDDIAAGLGAMLNRPAHA
jgi:AcrR family transcriptional regulator